MSEQVPAITAGTLTSLAVVGAERHGASWRMRVSLR